MAVCNAHLILLPKCSCTQVLDLVSDKLVFIVNKGKTEPSKCKPADCKFIRKNIPRFNRPISFLILEYYIWLWVY